MTRVKSILGFKPFPVTFLTIATYISLFSALLFIDRQPPAVANQRELASWGVSVDEAWGDLEVLTRQFHPYNTRSNDVVRQYLLDRVHAILSENGVPGFATVQDGSGGYEGTVELIDDGGEPGKPGSNTTFTGVFGGSFGSDDITVYFEGTNIIVYIHGERPAKELSPVLVSAHYDSVSTGYGATDDGTAVVSILQIIKSFTRPGSKGGRRPKRGLVVLLNNGEEDYLNGARAFAAHPISKLPHAFLNLEGAGAGGRATLFRSTDAEVTKYYKQAKRPFGVIVSGDGFKAGLVRSGTDFSVFVDVLGMRGLDVAFYQPRSRYHTTEDDARHSSKRSLWHMLGGSLETLRAMTDDTSKVFDAADGTAGTGHDAVWFDVFGRTFSVLRLHTVFAFTITLIVVPFVVVLATMWALDHIQKLYYFSNTPYDPPPPEHSLAAKTTRGWRGCFRFPVAFVAAGGGVLGMAFLLNKVNPMIVYSSQYPVWACMLATWWVIAWVVLRGADVVRPTALARGYGFLQQWVLWFVLMIGVALGIGKYHLGSGYWVLAFYSGVFLSTMVSLLEMSALPKASEIEAGRTTDDRGYYSEGHSQVAVSEPVSDHDGDGDAGELATEETPLFRGPNRPVSFAPHRNARYDAIRQGTEVDVLVEERDEAVYGGEQGWSKDLPSWTWLVQFFLSVPLQLVLIVPVALLLGSGLSQTGADGSGMLTVFIAFGALSIIVLLPLAPFLHRISYHVTMFALLVAIGTGIYNLVAFPFSPNARLKVYFQQTVDLQTGENLVHLVGHADYIEGIVTNYIPSARGKGVVTCKSDDLKGGLRRCSWKGAPPRVVPHSSDGYKDWVFYNVTKTGEGKATITLGGKKTRACKLLFERSVDVAVLEGRGEHPSGNLSAAVTRNPRGGAGGFPNTRELRLWSREWERGWSVELTWPSSPTPGLGGTVVCLWSDANREEDEIPALHEVRRYIPVWAVVSKLADGLVEGSIPFTT